VPRPALARRVLVSALTVLAGAGAVAATAPAPAEAATVTTRTASCVDGGGVRWDVKAHWGATYRAADGRTKAAIDYVGWSTSKGGAVRTDARVRTLDGAGTQLQDRAWSGSYDYRAGTRFKSRNPVNPPSAPGQAAVVLSLGVDGDGFGSCTVRLVQPGSPAPVTTAPNPTIPAGSAADRFESDVVAATNAERAKEGLTALSSQACVDSYAEAQAQRMADQGTMFHQELRPVLDACGLRMVGENVAEGYASGKAVTAGWMASPGHRANIMKPEYRLLGVGAAQSSSGRWYSAQVFGTLR
jgi:hypothetical protein